MGCNNSKLDGEVVQLCKARRRFIKQAVEYRIQFSARHAAYVEALRRVSLALRDYIDGAGGYESITGSNRALPTVTKKTITELTGISSLSGTTIKSHTGSSCTVQYLRAGGNSSVSVIERPQSPEIMRIESYSPVHHFGVDGFFPSPYHEESFSLPFPIQTSQLDFFWDPFSSLDTYACNSRNSLYPLATNDETMELRQAHKQKGTSNVEREEGINEEMKKKSCTIDLHCASKDGTTTETSVEMEHKNRFQSQSSNNIEVSEAKNAEVEVSNEKDVATGGREPEEEMPNFTVHMSQKPRSMAEVIKNLETQFGAACNSAREVFMILEQTEPQKSTAATELTAAELLNPVALFRSTTSHSTSSPIFHGSCRSIDYGFESGSDISEESWMLRVSLRSTLDKLYEWEKKLYEEVKSGARIQKAYVKKCPQSMNQDVIKREDSSIDDKTRAMIQDLHAQMKVSMHTVRSVSKRINALIDEELQPQLMELIRRLSNMWRVMTECHVIQKHTVEEVKLILSDKARKLSETSSIAEHKHAHLIRSGMGLESELQNWRACFGSWVASQRSYARCLANWALQCIPSSSSIDVYDDDDDITTEFSFSPSPSNGKLNMNIFMICIQWSRFLDMVSEAKVMEGLDIFIAGVASACRLGEEARREDVSPDVKKQEKGGGVVTVVEEEKMEEQVAIENFFAGMSAAFDSLMEFAISSADGYEELITKWETKKKHRTVGSLQG